jgi:NTP pyrophosphatase (non-canonical NTP hydrolase)
MRKSLEEMQAEVHKNNVAHGWFEQDRGVGDDVALLHTEVSEMFEAYRTTGLSDATEDFITVRDGFGEEIATLQHKPEGFGSEAADVFIRLLDTCERRGVDLRFEYERKMAYNRTRPYKHGKNL